MLRAAVLATLVLATGAGPASAATVSFDAGTGLRVTAAAGEVNAVTLLFDLGGPAWIVRDTAPLTAGAGCSGGGAEVRCAFTPSSANKVHTVDLGDGNDSFNSQGNEFVSDGFVTGGLGDDTLLGGRGFDFLDAGDGIDRLEGLAGDDRLVGGPGRDLLLGGTGSDTLEGGDGADTVSYAGSARVAATLDEQANDQERSATGQLLSTDHIKTVENVIGSGGPDVLVGNSGLNRLEGGAGDDRLMGSADAATPASVFAPRPVAAQVAPTSGPSSATVQTFPTVTDATIRVGDVLLGGIGNDIIGGGPTNDSINGELGRDLIDSGLGQDSIFSRDGEIDLVRCDGGTEDRATIDLKDNRDPACEAIDEGALKELGHLRVRVATARVRGGRVAIPVQCPRGVTCRGRASFPGGVRVPYRLRSNQRAVLSLRARRGTRRLTLVETGREGPRTAIRTLRLR